MRWSLVSAPPCVILLLVLEKQLQELETALLASILDMEQYRKGSSSSSFSSPLKWADGLLLVHSCPPPLDQHLLSLLGCSAVRLLSRHLLFLPSFWKHLPQNLNLPPAGETQSDAQQPEKQEGRPETPESAAASCQVRPSVTEAIEST